MKLTEEKCNAEHEKPLRRILQKLMDQLKVHFSFLLTTIESQKTVIDNLWVLCSRYLILMNGAVCLRPYPRQQTMVEEKETREEFESVKETLVVSNKHLTASLCTVQEIAEAFDRALARVDASLPCIYIDGNQTRQPIYYYIELFHDLFKFFHKIQNHLNLLGNFLTVDDMGSILEYKELLQQDPVVTKHFENSINVEININK